MANAIIGGVTKTCNKCKTAKQLSEFHQKIGGAYGVRAACRLCRLAHEKRGVVPLGYSAAYYAKNKERQRLRDRSAQRSAYYFRTKAERIAYALAYAKRNPEVYAARAMERIALKNNATPSWADLDEIKQFYVEAKRRSTESDCKWHVDHIVPLKSKVVCGLHVSANLQVITAAENISKSNDYWPDMP